jgi:P-type E1-E2 ATPase
VKALVIDKTGTLTYGRARLVGIHPAPGFAAEEVLRLGASLDQASRHVIARAVVTDALERGLTLAVPEAVGETPGEGVEGIVERRSVVIGGERFVAERLRSPLQENVGDSLTGAVTVAVGVDGQLAGTLILSDELREGTHDLLANLRKVGIVRIVLATGDRQDVAEAIGSGLALDAIRSELTPDEKIAVVHQERKWGPVMMVGDGVNDAPALAAADLGVAMGASGAAASAEAADVVLLVNRLDRVLYGIQVARRSRHIALQSVYSGIGLSLGGMIMAALGHLTPVQGALVQEAIDVAVILNALRALRGGPAASE